MAKRWTDKDKDLLEKYWGEASLSLIAKKLNRTENAVKTKAHEMQLGPIKDGFDGFTLRELTKLINRSHSTLYKWVEQYNFPARRTKFSGRIYMVRTKQFWEWAKKHPRLLNFAEIEPLILGPEPEWVKGKRTEDEKKKQRFKNKGTAWTNEDDAKLISLCKTCAYTYPEIAEQLFRTESAIKERILELKIKYRPIPMTCFCPEDIYKNKPYRKWTVLENKALEEMSLSRKFNIVDISRKLERSYQAIRSQLIVLELPMPIPYTNFYSDEETDKIRQMFFDDVPIREIAEALDRSESAMRAKLKKMGLQLKNKEKLMKELIG